NAPLFGRAGLFPGRNPVRAIPKGAVYLNVSQFPARLPGIWRWLERRPDIRSAFLIHDLLPISHPEFFPPTERDQHSRFLRIAARLGRVLIVTSDATREQLAAHLSAEGLGKPRIEIAPLSVDPSFATEPRVELALRNQPYFVVCGTIEPRKNLLLLLNVWRELSHELGAGTPKLVIVGTRGWHNENVVDMLERCPAIAPHIIEVSGLSTPALKRLLDNCRAVLMPTFAEGFGLPVAEALTAGVPVICSEMPILATIHGGSVTRLDPLDGLGWLRIIRMTIDQPPHSTRSLTIGRSNNDRVMCFSSHIDRILRSLMK
ncbi:MAG: glycosyltransferase family 4 protein, partial [Hyphomicrobiaceae bacterium]